MSQSQLSRFEKFSLIASFLIVFFILSPTTGFASNSNTIKESIVKIYTVANQPDYQEPWNNSTAQFSGSGSIIEDQRILTNAHVIADSTFLEVKRYGQTKRYEAEVLFVSHDADLAVITVKNKKFFEGTTPLKLGDLPKTQEEVFVYGFPTGGDTLSVTKGVVSRIEHQQYAHSSEHMLSVQIDAAINPGNSGGPVISNGKISGVVMQGLRGADNIGYMVPTPTVQHFFKDMEDGTYDGFPDMGIVVQDMENPASRKKFKLDDNLTGVLAYNVLFNSPAKDIIKPGDILIKIDGHSIANDGTVEFRPKEYTSFGYYIDNHQIGEEISFDIIRDAKQIKVSFPLNTTSKDFWLVQREQYDIFPRYFIFGGFVFTPVTKNYVNSGSSFFGGAGELGKLLDEWPTPDRQEAVIISQVLAADTNKGYHNLYDWVIEKIDGEKFKNFNEFYKLIEDSKTEYITLENKDGYKVIINRELAISENDSVLERYHIDSERSKDLQSSAKKEKKDALKTSQDQKLKIQRIKEEQQGDKIIEPTADQDDNARVNEAGNSITDKYQRLNSRLGIL